MEEKSSAGVSVPSRGITDRRDPLCCSPRAARLESVHPECPGEEACLGGGAPRLRADPSPLGPRAPPCPDSLLVKEEIRAKLRQGGLWAARQCPSGLFYRSRRGGPLPEMLTSTDFGMNRPRLSSWEILGRSLQCPQPVSSRETSRPYLAWEATQALAFQ